MASGYPMFGSRLSYVEYLTAQSFVDDVTTATRDTGRRLSMDISRQTRDVIASNEALTRENIRATEIAAGEITDTMNNGFGDLSSTMKSGFTRLSYEMQEISSGIEDLNATFHWGFSQMIASMGRMNDSLAELIRIAKTPAQTAAYEQYEIARDALRRKLFAECIEAIDKAINGDQASSGYKLEWRFHQLKGTVQLGFVGCETSFINLADAEQSFLAAARYAEVDFPDHAAQAFLSAGWAAYCQGRMKEGLGHTEKALFIKPDLGEALFQAAKVRMALGEIESALPILDKAINIDRFYTLKAAGDRDFQRHDDKLRSFLDAMRKEKYRQAVPKVQDALAQVKRILALSPNGKGNKAISRLEEFLANGETWPLLDILAFVQGLNVLITEGKRLPIVIALEIPRTEEETYQEEESYSEEVVIKPAGFFSKAVTEMQTKTRTVTKKHTVSKTSSVRFDFCAIPAGTFLMENSSKRYQQVTISREFYMAKFPVTQAQWEAVMGNNPSQCKTADSPVEQVSWDDCQEFVKRLNASGKNTFRLPTDAEWEYACRAGSTSKYCFGDSEAQLGDYAWYSANAGGQAQPVGKKMPNAWGLHDMHGNVFEWLQDWPVDNSSEVTDPQGPPLDSNRRVARGGSWLHDANFASSDSRFWSRPVNQYDPIGFRLVCLSMQ